MCGIAGIWKLEEKGFDFLPIIKKLMELSEERGMDATGVAFLAKKEGTERTLFHHKLPIPPRQYAKDYADTIIPKGFKAIILHNRHATQGDPKINNNNHPFIANQPVPFAFIHNGMIHSKYKGTRTSPAETDSVEVFLEIWDEIEKAPQPENRMMATKAAMEKHEGSMTIAMLFPESIIIARHSNPCHLAYIPALKCIVFASTERMLEKSLGCVLELSYTIFRPYNMTEMKNDTLLRIDDNGITLGGEVEVGKIRTETTGERQWFSYGSPCEPTTAPDGKKVILEWKGGKGFEERERPPPVLTAEQKEKYVVRGMLKAGDLVEDLEGWKLKYLVVYSVVHDGVWGLFGETAEEAKKAYMEEREWKSSTKGGNIKWTKSGRFIVIERGLTRKGVPETPIKQSPPKGKPEVISEYIPQATDKKLEADWERYLYGEEAGN